MKEIIIARCAGFCEGVEQAYKTAVSKTGKGLPGYMIGNLVHNSAVVEKLEKHGIKRVKTLEEIPVNFNGSVLFSAHGVSPAIKAAAQKRGLKIIDTTCAWVRRAQKIAGQMAEEGSHVIIIGDRDHPEVAGLFGWAKGRASIIENAKDIEPIPQKNKFGVIAQTTQSIEKFENLVKLLKSRFPKAEFAVHNTICGATQKRQKEAVSLAKKTDIIIVVGDKKSANTRRLFELCQNINKNTYWIESGSGLKDKWLAGKNKIGITAGASTPEWVIKEVLGKIEKP